MILTLALVSATTAADLDALGVAVAACDRAVVNPVFLAEAERRSDLMRATFREQEAIVAQRRGLAARRLELRQQAAPGGYEALTLAEAAVEERQQALNDQRLLEALRRDTMDAMRHHFLQTCPAGKGRS